MDLWRPGNLRLLKEYSFSSSVSSRAYFTGYLNQCSRSPAHGQPTIRQLNDSQPMVLCVVGGGQDGFQLAEAFVQARLPDRWRGTVITGPFMPKEHQQRLHQLAKVIGLRRDHRSLGGDR